MPITATLVTASPVVGPAVAMHAAVAGPWAGCPCSRGFHRVGGGRSPRIRSQLLGDRVHDRLGGIAQHRQRPAARSGERGQVDRRAGHHAEPSCAGTGAAGWRTAPGCPARPTARSGPPGSCVSSAIRAAPVLPPSATGPGRGSASPPGRPRRTRRRARPRPPRTARCGAGRLAVHRDLAGAAHDPAHHRHPEHRLLGQEPRRAAVVVQEVRQGERVQVRDVVAAATNPPAGRCSAPCHSRLVSVISGGRITPAATR